MSWRKIAFVGTMSGMTLMTISACRWQYNRYHYSVDKWKRLDEQFDSDCPPEFSFEVLPWDNVQISKDDSLDELEYKLIRLSGTLHPERFLVHRTSEGRPGFLVMAALSAADSKHSKQDSRAVALNLGWIPAHLKEEFEKTKDAPEESVQVTALIKKPEKVDFINQSTSVATSTTQKAEQTPIQQTTQNITQTNNSYFNSYIDLELIKETLKNECSIEQKVYLEKFLLSKNRSNDEELYPVCSSPQSFQRPYLTPDKHQSYCLFWGCCSTFGIYTIFRALFRM